MFWQRVDLEAITRGFSALSSDHGIPQVTPFENIVDAGTADPSLRESWNVEGLRLVADGGAACILMAGGAGTRLGFAAPKGMYGSNA